MIRVEMELLSDVIFGSGYSIPGGEDIALCQDDDGWPYLKGSTLKGLLRESLTNYLAWTGGGERDLDAILGGPGRGWNAADEARKARFTPLTLSDDDKARLGSPDACHVIRAFTSIENGNARAGTLRQARCARRGLRFAGELHCAPEDADLLRKALAGVRWVGTMRNRGFGEVRTRGVPADDSAGRAKPVENARCVRFRIRADAPVFVTHLESSQGNSYDTRGYIPGSALRGFVMSALSTTDPAWFAEHRRELLSDSTRFLDAVPVRGGRAVIPAPRGFYEDKSAETDDGKEIVCVLTGNGDISGMKAAKIGAFCRLDGDAVSGWRARTGGVTRINRADGEETDKNLFSVQTLDDGQEFEGYFFTDNPALSGKISACMAGTLWLGADRCAGFGKCTLLDAQAAQVPAWVSEYGFREGDALPDTLYMLAVSPLSMLDERGTPCGIHEARLAEKLGVESVVVEASSAPVTEFGGYNRTWGSRTACASLYERGSVFRLKCARPPALDALRRVETEGLGIRRAEGLGQVLFLRNELFENIRRRIKEDSREAKSPAREKLASARRARYRWLTERVPEVRQSGLSRSQLGTLQSLCEASLSRGGWDELEAWLVKNLNERGARHGSRFVNAYKLIRDTLEKPLSETLSEEGCPDSLEERLRLLIELFDFSRRGRSE